jgi:hypothetical protein
MLLEGEQKGHAIHEWHLEIANDRIKATLDSGFEPRLTIGGVGDLVTSAGKDLLGELA